VVGGEHGIWWAVPHTDYFEGMMSSNPHFAWPAGHLVRPKSRDETYTVKTNTWDAYDRHGIGHETRVPLWELVFHDCVVTTWYWGDSSDFLSQVDPSNQDRKDAFNVLYGTMPMLWANKEGAWNTSRERFLETFHRVSPVTRVLAEQEMVDHKFLSEDRAVQSTRFADGTEVIAHFGDQERVVEAFGQSFRLPPYGFIVRGPAIQAQRVVEP
jgi:hypothetical protein